MGADTKANTRSGFVLREHLSLCGPLVIHSVEHRLQPTRVALTASLVGYSVEAQLRRRDGRLHLAC